MKPLTLSIALYLLPLAARHAVPVTGWVDRLNNRMLLTRAGAVSPLMGDGSAEQATALRAKVSR